MRLLVENPALYVAMTGSDLDEVEFLTELAQRTGCGLLLDLNNVIVSAENLGFDAVRYVDRFPLDLVAEIHIAGHDETRDSENRRLLIDGHGSEVSRKVWDLLERVLKRGGTRPVLIERDNNLGSAEQLMFEVAQAQALLNRIAEPEKCHA